MSITYGAVTSVFLAAPAVAATAATVAPSSATSSTALPFTLPSTSTLRGSAKKVFANWVPPLPISLDNKSPDSDYYATQYLTPDGENGAHAAYGGYLRDRPIGRPVSTASNWQLVDMETEVRQAISDGIDGFTIVVYGIPGEGSDSQWNNILLMFQAAAAVDPGFRIVVMPDMTSGLINVDAATLAKYMSQLAAYPASYRLGDGRVVMSAFKAEAHAPSWWSNFESIMQNTYSTPIAFWPSVLNDSAISSFAPVSYGIADWGSRNPSASDPAPTYSTSPVGRVATAHSLGLKWMQPVSVQDERPRQGEYWEAENTQNLRNSWQVALKSNSDWVDLTTWNDLPEGSGMDPSAEHGWTFLDISAYYLTWFKTGTPPPITRDVIYLTHRKQPYAAQPSYPETLLMSVKGSDPARDTVEALTFLTSPATIRVTVGAQTYVCAGVAGVNSCLVPLGNGQVAAQVVRGGTNVTSVVSPYPVTSTPYVQDLQYVGATSGRQGGTFEPPSSATTATAVPTVVAVADTADTYANAGAPSTNYGSSSSISSRGDVAAVGYLRFDLPAAPAGTTLTGAGLHVRTTTDSTSGSADGFAIQEADNSWTESGLTWANRPATTGQALGTIPAGTASNTGYDVALSTTGVLPLLGSQRTVAVSGNGSDILWFWSRDYPTPNDRPRLQLSFMPDAVAPTTPGSLTASGANAPVQLSWQAATDNRAVVGYDVYRSATAGFTPSRATRIGTTSGTTFSDSGVAAGTWYYRVVAKDAAGNLSPASAPATDVVSSTAQTVTITPVADTYGDAGTPASNFATSWSLLSRGTPGGVTYMRFQLPAAPTGKTLTSASFRFHTTTGSSAGSSDPHTMTIASDAWTESSLTWDNRPAAGTTVVGTISGATAVDTAYSAPLSVNALTPQLGQQATLAVSSTGSDSLVFWSSNDGTPALRPQLLLTFS